MQRCARHGIRRAAQSDEPASYRWRAAAHALLQEWSSGRCGAGGWGGALIRSASCWGLLEHVVLCAQVFSNVNVRGARHQTLCGTATLCVTLAHMRVHALIRPGAAVGGGAVA